MIEKMAPGLYRIEVPLPKNPLRSINSYLIEGSEGCLLVDTGLKIEPCRAALESALRELNVDRGRMEIFVTHIHIDHLALAGELAIPGKPVMMGAKDVDFLTGLPGWHGILPLIKEYGFPADEYSASFTKEPSLAFSEKWWPQFRKMNDGDRVAVGGYDFRLVETPGHSPGHMCLFEEEKGILLTGDHVLGDISPNITGWDRRFNPLADYFASLDKVACLKVGLALPGHRAPIADLKKRIADLKAFHKERLGEIEKILADGPLDGYRLAARMTWDMKFDSWEELPVPQRWFATGEAISHARYLASTGEVEEYPENGVHHYRLKGERV